MAIGNLLFGEPERMAGEEATAGEMRKLGSDGLPESARSGGSDYAGDKGFIGVNMRLEPHQLPPGYCSSAVNMRFTRGVAEPRGGVMKLPWTNKITGGTSVGPWGTVYGAGTFSDPNTRTLYTIIAADGNVYLTCEGNAPQLMTLPSGVSITYEVRFVQAVSVLIMLRGFLYPPLVLKGVTQSWQAINQSALAPGDGTLEMPAAERGLFFQNRLWLVNSDDQVVASDLGNYTRYSSANVFSINRGSADRLVNIFKYNDSTLICFKERSIYALVGISASLGTAKADEVTAQFGLSAKDSVAKVGKDLWFLSELGVMSLTQTDTNALQGLQLPVSDHVQPLIDRINWRFGGAATAQYWNNRYYLGVPMDDAERIGDELLPTGTVYDPGAGPGVIVSLERGKTYRWTPGTNELSISAITDKGFLSFSTASDFTMDATALPTAAILATSTVCTASLKQVWKGVNGAIIVYDFLNQEWSGYDTSDDLDVKQLYLAPRGGRYRLFQVSNDGWINLYEEGVDDQLSRPYVDVVVASKPAVGNTLRVNGGTVVTATGLTVNTAAGNWGCSTLAFARTNVFEDVAYNGGFMAGTTWTAPNTFASRATNGARFYGTNGVVPTVVTTGIWSTVTYYACRAVEWSMTTRAVGNDGGGLCHYDLLELDLQTFNPRFSVEVLTDGVEESRTVASDVTKDRLKWYRPFDKADFDGTNASGLFMDPYRKDYSVVLLSTGTAGIYLGDGIGVDRHQEVREGYALRESGRSLRVTISGDQGRVRVMGWRVRERGQMTVAGSRA